MKRMGIVGLLAMFVGGSGCAGTARRDDGTLMFQPKTWSAAPAPDQVEVVSSPAATPNRATFGRVESQGLAKYFPALRKGSPEPTRVASSYRPSWFGLRKAKPQAQVYTTDARSGLYRGPTEPSLLPVALRVPTDPSVRITAAEGARKLSAGISDPVAGGANESPDATKAPATPRSMPEVPAIDPREAPKDPNANASAGEEERATVAAKVAAKKGDEKPEPAVSTPADPNQSLGLPGPMLPASYVKRNTMTAPGHVHSHVAPAGPVLASPQVQPTSKTAAPSPQSAAKTTVVAKKKWKRPCLRRLVRKKWKLGEFANPPTAAPH